MEIKSHSCWDFDYYLLHGIMIHIHLHIIFIPITTYQTTLKMCLVYWNRNGNGGG